MTNTQLTLEEISTLAKEALIDSGASAGAASSLAAAVTAAERDGIRSHGLIYVPIYCEHLKCGKVNAAAEPAVLSQDGSAIVIDADCGFAHPAIDIGFDKLRPLAKALGCAALTVRNSYNCGVLGYHVERLAEEGLVAIGFTNAPASIAPAGGQKPVVGTNPFALAVPGDSGGAAFVLDQSASVVAKSEIMTRSREGRPIPEGWALDADGQPTTDPEQALKGSMAPSGGYKGFGIGLLVEVMAAALSGATLGIHASPFSGTEGGPPRTGQCFLALSPDAFSSDAFDDRIHALTQAITTQGEARLPGSRRLGHRQRSESDGVSVDQSLVDRIQSITVGNAAR